MARVFWKQCGVEIGDLVMVKKEKTVYGENKTPITEDTEGVVIDTYYREKFIPLPKRHKLPHWVQIEKTIIYKKNLLPIRVKIMEIFFENGITAEIEVPLINEYEKLDLHYIEGTSSEELKRKSEKLMIKRDNGIQRGEMGILINAHTIRLSHSFYRDNDLCGIADDPFALLGKAIIGTSLIMDTTLCYFCGNGSLEFCGFGGKAYEKRYYGCTRIFCCTNSECEGRFIFHK